MGNIVNDIVDEINIKPNKTKLILKWVVGISSTLIVTAFALGQFKASFFNRMDGFEEKLDKNTVAIEQLRTDISAGFRDVDLKIDKVYDDAVVISDDYREYNRKQLELVVDYGHENKEMLKRMLELNAMENKQSIATQVAKAKNDVPEFSVGVHQVVDDLPPKENLYYSMVQFIEIDTKDTIFQIAGATQNFINSIDRENYQIGAITESHDYPNRYDFSYRNSERK